MNTKRPPLPFSIPARYPGRCPFCGATWEVGAPITKRNNQWGHLTCPQATANTLGRGVDMPSDSPLVNSLTLKGQPTPLAHGPTPAPTAAGPLSFLSSTPAVRLDREPEVESVAAVATFVPSRFHTPIFDYVDSGSGNLVIVAGPGSGKTSTLKQIGPRLPHRMKVAAIAFNKRNAADLQRVMPENVRSSTFHSLGLANVKRQYPQIKVDENKVWGILRDIEQGGSAQAEVVNESGAAIRQMIGLIKTTLSGDTNDDLARLSERYGLPLNGNAEAVYELTRLVLRRSNIDRTVADFGDMLLWCVQGSVPCETFDFVLQDEAQDAPQVQIEFVKRILKPGGRLLAVGDPRQALYAWSGSATDSLDQLTRYHHATNFPLSITYRMPITHVEHLNRRFPDAKIEARPGAPQGVIANRSYPEMIRNLQSGDIVEARVNAALIEPCFQLIREGRKATILGRDVGKGLVVLLTKIEKRFQGVGLGQVISALQDYGQREIAKLLNAKRPNQAQTLGDQVETLVALSDGCRTTDDIRKKIDTTFSDDEKGVIFSTIHKIKGGESERVYFLKPELCPHPLAKEDWQRQGEENCLFVALSRSKSELYFVSGE